MITLHTKDTAEYVRTGLICYKCLLVIDRQAPGRKRRCINCRHAG